MRIDNHIYRDRALWEAKGWHIPDFDREAVMKRTRENPIWVHFGGGNIFRAFIGRAVSGLLEQGKLDRGLIVAESFDWTLIDEIYLKHDLVSLAVTVDGNGEMKKSVVNSIVEALHAGPAWAADMKRLRTIFSEPSLQLVSFTITEKGYAVTNGMGELLTGIRADMENKPEQAATVMGIITALLLERFNKGGAPLALVSMDNCSANGHLLWKAVHTVACGWRERGFASEDFVKYVDDPGRVAFPWTMIDKITPRPSQKVQEFLEADGIEDLVTLDTRRHTFASAFVNGEAFECLVIEDSFPGGRPPLEAAGFLMTDREHVEKAERMKVCTCLNPLHTLLAVFGCLLGKSTIAQAVEDPVLVTLVRRLGCREGLPVVTDPEILSPKQFLEDVIQKRLPNPFIPDTPARIATDTSQKIPVRFGQTVKAWQQRGMDTRALTVIPLVMAGWCRYLIGIDDRGQAMDLSPDPRVEELCPVMKEAVRAIQAQQTGGDRRKKAAAVLASVLRDTGIWGCDLYESGLAEKVTEYFCRMLDGPGAIYRTLTEVAQSEAEEY